MSSLPIQLPQQIRGPREHLSSGTHACQLAAAAALVTLALQPDKHPLPGGSAAQYRGPFRQVLADMGLVQHLLDLEKEPWTAPEDLKIARNLAATGLLALAAPGTPLPRNQLQLISRHIAARAAAQELCVEEYQMLSGCLWLLLRSEDNLAYLLDTAPVLQTAADLLRGGVRGIMHAAPPPEASGVAWDAQLAALLGGGMPSVGKGMELLVLALWKLLEAAALRRKVPGVNLDSSCFVRTNTAWWQLRMDFR
jgi:hypothetical protein